MHKPLAFLINLLFLVCNLSLGMQQSQKKQRPSLRRQQYEKPKTIHEAAHRGDWDTIQEFLNNKVNINLIEKETGCIPLHKAALKGHWHTVEQLIAARSEVHAKDIKGNTPLMLAALEGRVKAGELLLKNGAKINHSNNDGDTPLALAALKGYNPFISLLLTTMRELQLDISQEVNSENHQGSTPIHLAAIRGCTATVELLLDHGALIDYENHKTQTALNLAALTGHMSTVKLLLDRKADPNHQDKEGKTPLTAASAGGYMGIVRLLIERGAQVNHQSAEKKTALMFAVLEGNADIVEFLLDTMRKQQLDVLQQVNCKNCEGQTALMLAALEGRSDIIKLLLKNGAQVKDRANNGTTALSAAALKGHKDVVILLLDNGADIHHQDERGRNALMLAALEGHEEVVELLLERGALATHEDNEGNTSLSAAAINGHTAVVKLLLDRGARSQINYQNTKGRKTALMLASKQGRVKVIKVLLEEGADSNIQEKRGKTALVLAVIKNNKHEVLELLLSYGAHINTLTTSGATALDIAYSKGNTQLSDFLRRHGGKPARELKHADRVIEPKSVQSKKREDNKHSSGSIEVIRVDESLPIKTVPQIAQTEAQSSQASPGRADKLNMPEIVHETKSARRRKKKEGSHNNFLDIIVLPLEQSRAKEVSACKVEETLQKAFDTLDEQLLSSVKIPQSLLNSQRIKTLVIQLLDDKQYNREKVAKFIERLIRKGFSVNTQASNRMPLITLALEAGDTAVATMLLEQSGINLTLCDDLQRTPLLVALALGNYLVAERILDSSCNRAVNQPDGRGVTPLLQALRIIDKEQRQKFVLALLDAGAQPTRESAYVALDSGDTYLAQVIAGHDKVNRKLLEAVRKNNKKQAEEALREGAQINSINRVGETPLHIAARNGNEELVRFLLSCGANTHIADLECRTPFSVAASDAIRRIVTEDEVRARVTNDNLLFRFMNLFSRRG